MAIGLRSVAMTCWAVALSTGITLAADAVIPTADVESCTGQVGLCSHGFPATVSAKMLQAWHAVPGQPAELNETDPCSLPGATCAAPVPAIVRLANHVAETAPRRLAAKTADEYLADWSAASAVMSPTTDRDAAWLQRMNLPVVSAHAIDIAARLRGPVAAADLQKSFAWSVEAIDPQGVSLLAVPQDETARLFCPRLRIGLSARSELTTVAACDRNGEWKSISLPTAAAQPTIVAVGAEEFPPSPLPSLIPTAPLIRFAAGTIEIEIELE